MYPYYIKETMYLMTSRKTWTRFGIYISLLILAILVALLPHIINKKNHLSPHQMRFPTDLKYILFWNPPGYKKKYSRNRPEFPTGQTAFIEQKCPQINCYITYNKNILKKDESNFDAVVFNIQDISKINELNFTRSPYQKYIFRSHESAESHPVCNHKFDHFFNLTWTYKLNSDIPHPFINIYDVNKKLVGPKKKVHWITNMNHTDNMSKISRKNKAVAWIVTKCETKEKHADFVRELRSELKGYNYTVDIFGPCGEKQCPGPGRSIFSCHKMIERKYFFQLVLEESLAADYVTDGIVKSMMQLTIPLTTGCSDYTRFLPPGSYINTRTFDMKKLGALIDYLIKNPKMYEFFFDWKNHYFYTMRSKSYVCDLCTKLNSNHSKHKIYRHFRHWWNPEYRDICDRMRLLNLFNSEA